MLNEIFHFKEDIMLELTISSISTAIINLVVFSLVPVIFSAFPAVYGSVDCLCSDCLYSSTQYPLPLHINLCTVFRITNSNFLSITVV